MSEFFVFIILFVPLCVTSESQLDPLYAPGQILIQSTDSDDIARDTAECGNEVGPVCSSDCKTLMSCIRPGAAANKNECYKYNPDKPFCVGGICTNIRDSNNSNCNNIFQCTSKGIFPDPDDCTVYHYCTGASDSKPIVQVCPPTYTYNSLMKTCKRTNECQKIDCSRKANQMLVFQYDPAYYAYCYESPDGLRETIMYKCPDDVNFVYSLTKKECIYNCKKEGNFVDRTKCNGYVSCFRVGNAYDYRHMVCAPGYYFNNTQCMPEGATPCVSELTIEEDSESDETTTNIPQNDSTEATLVDE